MGTIPRTKRDTAPACGTNVRDVNTANLLFRRRERRHEYAEPGIRLPAPTLAAIQFLATVLESIHFGADAVSLSSKHWLRVGAQREVVLVRANGRGAITEARGKPSFLAEVRR